MYKLFCYILFCWLFIEPVMAENWILTYYDPSFYEIVVHPEDAPAGTLTSLSDIYYEYDVEQKHLTISQTDWLATGDSIYPYEVEAPYDDVSDLYDWNLDDFKQDQFPAYEDTYNLLAEYRSQMNKYLDVMVDQFDLPHASKFVIGTKQDILDRIFSGERIEYTDIIRQLNEICTTASINLDTLYSAKAINDSFFDVIENQIFLRPSNERGKIWGQYLYNYTNIKSSNGFSNMGVGFGTDFMLSDNFLLGIGGSFNEGKTNVNDIEANTQTNTVVIYAKYMPNDFYISTMFSYANTKSNLNNLRFIETDSYRINNFAGQLLIGEKLINNLFGETGLRYSNFGCVSDVSVNNKVLLLGHSDFLTFIMGGRYGLENDTMYLNSHLNVRYNIISNVSGGDEMMVVKFQERNKVPFGTEFGVSTGININRWNFSLEYNFTWQYDTYLNHMVGVKVAHSF